MSIFSYIKDKAVPLIISILMLVMMALALYVFGTTSGAIVTVIVLFILLIVGVVAWDYLARRRFYQTLKTILDAENDAHYLTELLDRPQFREGALTYDALEVATKHMNDRIAEYRLGSEDYREYIETWVHEIKTPIAASRLIIENREDESLRPLLQELDRIESFTEQVLYYSRSAAVEKDYAIQAVNLDKVIKGVLRKQSRTLIEQGITPRLEDLDIEVYTDPKWLDFIIGQIVTNAAKYQRAKEEAFVPEILFSAERATKNFEDRTVILRISDNGIGISTSDISRIFNKGFTGENGRRYTKSTGIGLYLCKKLCTKMKIGIAAESEKGKGTTISLIFPLNKMYFLE